MPRQNGKNACLEIVELFLAVLLGVKILHTAHQVKTARKHFRRLKHFFGNKVNDPTAQYPELNDMVTELRNVNGQEAIILDNGGSIEIIARSSASGRGFTVDVIICDEAQDMSDDDQESLMSTASSAPSGNPIWIYTGTPPGPKSNGEVFTRIRTESLKRSGRPRSWIEWSPDELADPPIDPTDREVWREMNPALGSGRLIWKVVEAEFEDLSRIGFCRERLGMWSAGTTLQAIPEPAWRSVADRKSFPMDRYALGVMVNTDRSMAAVGFAGRRSNGTWHIEIDEERPGTGWVVEWVIDRVSKNSIVAVVIDSASPAISLVDDLEDAGVKVTQIGTKEIAGACGSLYDGIVGTVNDFNEVIRTIYHTDQVQLNTSLAVARRKPVLGNTAWVWDGREEDSNVLAMQAVTLALWGSQGTKNKKIKRPAPRRRTGRRRAVLL